MENWSNFLPNVQCPKTNLPRYPLNLLAHGMDIRTLTIVSVFFFGKRISQKSKLDNTFKQENETKEKEIPT